MEEKTVLCLLMTILTILILILFTHLLFRVQRLEQKYDNQKQVSYCETYDYCERKGK